MLFNLVLDVQSSRTEIFAEGIEFNHLLDSADESDSYSDIIPLKRLKESIEIEAEVEALKDIIGEGRTLVAQKHGKTEISKKNYT